MEEQLQQAEINNFYTSDGRRIGDFCLGFFGAFIILPLLWFLYTFFISSFYKVLGRGGGVIIGFSSVIVIIIGLLSIILSSYFLYKSRRKYIFFGILMAVLIPLLIFGACLIVLSNAQW